MNTMLARDRYRRANGLVSPARNRYFYGKLLDADHLDLEQRYFLDMGRLVNRLTLGAGVLCGLHVVVQDGKVLISPGVAIDGLGREIVVTEVVTVDPWALESEQGSTVAADSLVLLLCYLECDAEPAPVLVADCEIREDCVPGVVRERFAIRAVDASAWHAGGHIDEVTCRALFGTTTADTTAVSHELAVSYIRRSLLGSSPGLRDVRGAARSDRRDLLAELVRPSCAPGPDCVPIALVTRSDGAIADVDEFVPRTTIYSNTVLLDLILCLAERVDECCGHRVATEAPVITEMYPAPGDTVAASDYKAHLEGAAFSLTFSHEMDPARLKAPNDWMRVLVVPGTPTVDLGPGGVAPMTPAVARAAAPLLLGAAGSGADIGAVLVPVEFVSTDPATARTVYRYTDEGEKAVHALRELLKPDSMQVAVVIRSDDVTQIADTADPVELLDADFAATGLSGALTRELLWMLDVTGPVPIPVSPLFELTLELPASAALPTLPSSGNGIEGGIFHAWFELDLTA